VSRLRELERDAAAADPSLAGAPCFRDPERLREAAGVVARARAEARPARADFPRPSVQLDAERWVLAWPTVDALLVEDEA
jgi:hypothetical protein